MNKLLLFFLLFQISTSFSQEEVFQDLVNHTVVYYSSAETEINNPKLDLLEEATYIELKDDQWPGAAKINTLIRNQLNELKTPDFALRFEREYIKALKSTLINWYNTQYSDLAHYFKPGNLHAEFCITTLCDHILVGGINVSFNAEREQRQLSATNLSFSDLHYYDLIRGVEIDPSTILDKRKQREFQKLIKSRIPEHLKAAADTLNFTKGFPLFNGAGFYYFIEGNIEADTDEQTVLQIRISLEEALPFLNPDGPFKAYLAIKPSYSKTSGDFMYDESVYYDFRCLREVESLRSFERFTESLTGDAYTNQTVHIVHERNQEAEVQISFNKLGKVTNRKVHVPKERISDDSVAYVYHLNGKLKSINRYELFTIKETEERDEFHLVEAFLFDEQQNLIKQTTYKTLNYHPGDIESTTQYFSYFNDRIITDISSETNCASGYEWGTTEYGIYEGSAFFLQNNDDIPDKRSYTTRHSGDSVFVDLTAYNKTVTNLFYRMENGRIVEFTEDQGHYLEKITYDSSQRPILFSSFKKTNTGFVPYTTAAVEYDSKNRPVKYTHHMLQGDQKLNKPQVYLLRYESK
jgi:hypothetical protein